MSVIAEQDLDRIDLGDLEHWDDGPPHDLFARLRREAPLHWSPLDDYPEEAGFWSLTRAADLREVSLDWRDLLLLRRRDHGPRRLRDPARGPAAADDLDGPAAPRPDQGAVSARLHPEADRRARGADPRDRQPRARPGLRARRVRARQRRRRPRRLARDRLVHRHARGGRPAPHRGDEHGARLRRRRPAPDRGGRRRDDDPRLGRDDGDRSPSAARTPAWTT